MPRTKAPLPDNSVIARAMQAFREDPANQGRLPRQESKGHEPDGWPNGWASIIARLRKERGLTPLELMVQEGYMVKKDKAPLPEDTILARDVFNGAVRFVNAQKRLPEPANDRDHIAGYTVSDLVWAFRDGYVSNMDEIPAIDQHIQSGKPPPALFEDFMVVCGFAVPNGSALELAEETPALLREPG